MTAVKLHLLQRDEKGKPYRRTFLIREDGCGDVEIVDARGPFCDADRSVPIYLDHGEDGPGAGAVLEVERVA